ELSAATMATARGQMKMFGVPGADQFTDDQIRALVDEQGRRFRDDAPTSAAQAATIILNGVKSETWRILVGDDAHSMDEMVRADPVHAYEPGFFERMAGSTGWRLGGGPAARS
ncbi:MAG TPA: hypothetical protein VFE13_10375, partial [Caulobacteraceae bacterium]|nr:hypothetical protein [Caulobacteraceae bacterium]